MSKTEIIAAVLIAHWVVILVFVGWVNARLYPYGGQKK